MITVRASSMPLVMRCPGAARGADLKIDQHNAAADIGTVTHEALEPLARGGDIDWSELAELCLKRGVPHGEVKILCHQAAKLWALVCDSFPDALTEIALSAQVDDLQLTGHCDILSVTGAVARGGDWKTGRKDSDYAQQLRSYCALILIENPDLEEATMAALWVRDSEIENYTMRREELAEWLTRAYDTIVAWNGTYHPGDHCLYCPRAHECEAANALARRDIAALSDKSLVARAECELGLMAPGEILDLHAKAQLVGKYSERVLQAIRNHVIAHGPIADENGNSLGLVEETRTQLDPMLTWPVLERAGFQDEDFAEVVEIRGSKVKNKIAKAAGRGKGAAAVRQLQAELEAAGAVQTTKIKKIQRRNAR